MKNKLILSVLLLSSLIALAFKVDEPWTKKQIIEPEILAQKLHSKKQLQPLILNIGPVGSIKNAIEFGAMDESKNVSKLKSYLHNIKKDKEIIIYCGCCPFTDCPNIRPAFKLLTQMSFKNHKLLNLPQNLKVNWIDKGFPMEK